MPHFCFLFKFYATWHNIRRNSINFCSHFLTDVDHTLFWVVPSLKVLFLLCTLKIEITSNFSFLKEQKEYSFQAWNNRKTTSVDKKQIIRNVLDFENSIDIRWRNTGSSGLSVISFFLLFFSINGRGNWVYTCIRNRNSHKWLIIST